MRYVLAAGVLGGVATGEPVASELVKILTGGFDPTGSAGRPADPAGCCRDSGRPERRRSDGGRVGRAGSTPAGFASCDR